MESYFQDFLAKTGKSKLPVLCLFGKHPGWPDHMHLNLESKSLQKARRTFYHDALGSIIDRNLWKQADGQFDHWFAWLRGDQVLVGSIQPSRDSRKRYHYPLIVALHDDWQAKLSRWSVYGELLKQTEAELAKAAESIDEKSQEFVEEETKSILLEYQSKLKLALEKQGSEAQPVHVERFAKSIPEDARKCWIEATARRSQHYRLHVPGGKMETLLGLLCLLRTQCEPGVPILLTTPCDVERSEVDVTFGMPTAEHLYALKADPATLEEALKLEAQERATSGDVSTASADIAGDSTPAPIRTPAFVPERNQVDARSKELTAAIAANSPASAWPRLLAPEDDLSTFHLKLDDYWRQTAEPVTPVKKKALSSSGDKKALPLIIGASAAGLIVLFLLIFAVFRGGSDGSRDASSSGSTPLSPEVDASAESSVPVSEQISNHPWYISGNQYLDWVQYLYDVNESESARLKEDAAWQTLVVPVLPDENSLDPFILAGFEETKNRTVLRRIHPQVKQYSDAFITIVKQMDALKQAIEGWSQQAKAIDTVSFFQEKGWSDLSKTSESLWQDITLDKVGMMQGIPQRLDQIARVEAVRQQWQILEETFANSPAMKSDPLGKHILEFYRSQLAKVSSPDAGLAAIQEKQLQLEHWEAALDKVMRTAYAGAITELQGELDANKLNKWQEAIAFYTQLPAEDDPRKQQDWAKRKQLAEQMLAELKLVDRESKVYPQRSSELTNIYEDLKKLQAKPLYAGLLNALSADTAELASRWETWNSLMEADKLKLYDPAGLKVLYTGYNLGTAVDAFYHSELEAILRDKRFDNEALDALAANGDFGFYNILQNTLSQLQSFSQGYQRSYESLLQAERAQQNSVIPIELRESLLKAHFSESLKLAAIDLHTSIPNLAKPEAQEWLQKNSDVTLLEQQWRTLLATLSKLKEALEVAVPMPVLTQAFTSLADTSPAVLPNAALLADWYPGWTDIMALADADKQETIKQLNQALKEDVPPIQAALLIHQIANHWNADWASATEKLFFSYASHFEKDSPKGIMNVLRPDSLRLWEALLKRQTDTPGKLRLYGMRPQFFLQDRHGGDSYLTAIGAAYNALAANESEEAAVDTRMDLNVTLGQVPGSFGNVAKITAEELSNLKVGLSQAEMSEGLDRTLNLDWSKTASDDGKAVTAMHTPSGVSLRFIRVPISLDKHIFIGETEISVKQFYGIIGGLNPGQGSQVLKGVDQEVSEGVVGIDFTNRKADAAWLHPSNPFPVAPLPKMAGVPSGDEPMRLISALGVKVFASFNGARVPTIEEWQKALEAQNFNPKAANLFDAVWQRFRGDIERNPAWSGQIDDYRIGFIGFSFHNYNTVDDWFASMYQHADGKLLFADVNDDANTIKHLVGNAAEYVTDAASETFYVIGGSALTGKNVQFGKPVPIEASAVNDAFNDVGFRLCFDAPYVTFREKLMAKLVQAYEVFTKEE